MTTSIPDTVAAQGAGTAGVRLRVWDRRVARVAEAPAAWAGGGQGLSHPQLSPGQWPSTHIQQRRGGRGEKPRIHVKESRRHLSPAHPTALRQASPGSTSPRTSTMCRGSWLTSAGGCSGSSIAGGAAFSNSSRRAGSFRGDTMEKWIPRCRREHGDQCRAPPGHHCGLPATTPMVRPGIRPHGTRASAVLTNTRKKSHTQNHGSLGIQVPALLLRMAGWWG